MQRALIAFMGTLAITASLPGFAARPDRYAAVAQQVIDLKKNNAVRISTIGKSALGRPIYSLFITDPNNTTTIDSERVRVLFICGQHGDESSSVKAMTALAGDLARTSDPQMQVILSKAVIAIVPVANPDGFSAFRRLNARGADLNRNWSAPNQPETTAIAGLVSDFRPQVVIDEHEWLDSGPLRKTSVELAGFGTDHQYRLARMLAANVRTRMARHGVNIAEVRYQPQARPDLAHRHFTGSGICSMLIETTPELSPTARAEVYQSFAKGLLVALTTPSDRVAANLSALANSSRIPKTSLVAMYSNTPSEKLPDLTQPLIFAALGCIMVFSVGLRNSKSREDEKIVENDRTKSLCIPITDILDLGISTRQTLVVLRQYRRRPTDRQDAMKKPLKIPGVLLDPSENRALGVDWDSGIQSEITRRPALSSEQRQLLSDRTLARHLANPAA